MTSLKTSIKTITYLSDIGCLEIQGASLVTLTRSGQAFTVNNPTPYYVIISNASAQKNGNPAAGFSPLVIEPKTTVPLNVKMDSVPVLTYVNDFGARMPLFFQCNGNSCQVDEEQSRKG
ncbi:hypothetical protein G958_02657 [Escherichia coli UMEA 3271-1]|nr:hypothetical protein G958_02657 [Escherichia coli UMEA 3271-1]